MVNGLEGLAWHRPARRGPLREPHISETRVERPPDCVGEVVRVSSALLESTRNRMLEEVAKMTRMVESRLRNSRSRSE